MQPVKKEKKINVKFFLNQALEPVTGDKGQLYYALYIRVTFDRKNMGLKSKFAEYYQNLHDVDPALMEFEERILRKIIEYEAGQSENEYELKGLKHKYEIYSTSIDQTMESYLKPRLRTAILKTNDELTTVLNFQQPQATVDRLYRAAQILFPGFDDSLPNRLREDLTNYGLYRQLHQGPVFNFMFPTVIDWVDGAYQKELEKRIRANPKAASDTVKRVFPLIELAVKDNLKQL